MVKEQYLIKGTVVKGEGKNVVKEQSGKDSGDQQLQTRRVSARSR